MVKESPELDDLFTHYKTAKHNFHSKVEKILKQKQEKEAPQEQEELQTPLCSF